jgi:hypothetical protein
MERAARKFSRRLFLLPDARGIYIRHDAINKMTSLYPFGRIVFGRAEAFLNGALIPLC